MDAAALRARFPVLERVVYLNTGTNGPVATPAVEAAQGELERELEDGRGPPHFERRSALSAELRGAYAGLVGAAPTDVALVTSTSDGLGRVLAGLDPGPGDEIVTSDAEHPGLIGPLIAARAGGARVRAVPLRDLADAVGPRTTLVACSHVSWITGEIAPAALAEVDVPVVFDGAQGAGAVPVDVGGLGCAAYAAAGQKWLCGADGTGLLYLTPEFRERVRCTAPSYGSFVDAGRGLEAELREDAARHDAPALPRAGLAYSAAAFAVLADAGWDGVFARARELAAWLAARLAESGRAMAPRGDSTLVAWTDDDAEATSERLAAAGIVVRHLPGRGLVRASVGAWSRRDDLERLISTL